MDVNETSFSTNNMTALTAVRPVAEKAKLSRKHGQRAHSYSNFKYKVRNAEYFSEIIVPNISVENVDDAQQQV
jgi:hypothetical protein